jgi:hypothetical protein
MGSVLMMANQALCGLSPGGTFEGENPSPVEANTSTRFVRNMVHVVLYSADKAVIVYIVHSELYRIIILNNNYDYYSIDITASALYS